MRMAALVFRSLAAAALFATPVLAATDPGEKGAPDATMLISEKSADIGVGATWGGGTLHYQGRSYHFTIKGVDVAAVGFSNIVGHGRVYKLKHLHDFDGTYIAANGEATLGDGIGGKVLANGSGVVLHVDDLTKGARLAGGAQGITLQLAGGK